jgi:thiol-disulfide isomerase/thioredoxin
VQARELINSIEPGRRLVGRQAPEFRVPLLSGPETSVASALAGKKALLINFWFLRCAPCRAELPALQKLHDEFKDDGLAILAINSDDDREAIDRYVATSGWTFPIGLGFKERKNQNIPANFFVDLFPTNYLLDHSGKVVYRQAGWDEAGLRRALQALGFR